MEHTETYEKFIAWLKTAPLGFPESDDMTELIMARYTAEDAALLTGVPFSPKSIEALCHIKKMSEEELKPRMDALAKKGVVWKIFNYGKYRYRLCDPFLVFYRSLYSSGGRNIEHYMKGNYNGVYQSYTGKV